MKRRIPIALLVCLGLGGFQSCNCDDELDSCIVLTEIQTDEVSPAGVRTVFRALDCAGEPIADLTDADLTVLLDGQAMKSEGNVAPVLSQAVKFEKRTMLLLDMSDSIVQSGSLPEMVNAARSLVTTLISQGHDVAIYRFAGPAYFGAVQDFTNKKAPLDAALDELAESSGLGTTDLYGSIVKALQVLDAVTNPDVLSTTTLILFTDGSDEAMSTPATQAQKAVDNSPSNVFTVGLGGDVDKDELVALGKDGFEWAENSSDLQQAFSRVLERINSISRSYYLLAICSPRVGGWRAMTIEVVKRGEFGELEVQYWAENFDIVGCDPAQVADPCKDKQCGYAEGFDCGDCGDFEYCNDEQVCVDACAEVECGEAHGVDCGDCSDLGDSWSCQEQVCVDACEGRECGENMGFDCGDCGELYGADWGCDPDGACQEACAEVECGAALGVDCGDCSELGWGWACDAGACVQPCLGLECGEVLGVDCGECENGFSCNAANQCEPFALPGMNWVKIAGGGFTLGCNNSLDPACGFDEQRHSVLLSEFWIMDTEVTVDMYNQCVGDGACSTTYVGTGVDCNLGKAGFGQHPINCIEWAGLQEFCAYVGGAIPSEAQWERAMRGDYDGVAAAYRIYPWGNTPAPSCARVVMNDGGPGCGLGSTHAVGGKPATSFGLWGMAGNVAKWVHDWYSEELGACGVGDCTDPQGPENGIEKVVRGGNWNDMYDSTFRTAKRRKFTPSTKSAGIGGRCMRW